MRFLIWITVKSAKTQQSDCTVGLAGGIADVAEQEGGHLLRRNGPAAQRSANLKQCTSNRVTV